MRPDRGTCLRVAGVLPVVVTRDPAPGQEPEVGVTIVEPSELDVCTWTDDVDEKRRAFVVNQMSCGDIDGKVLVENMHAVCEWLKSGTLPAQSDRPKPTSRFPTALDSRNIRKDTLEPS